MGDESGITVKYFMITLLFIVSLFFHPVTCNAMIVSTENFSLDISQFNNINKIKSNQYNDMDISLTNDMYVMLSTFSYNNKVAQYYAIPNKDFYSNLFIDKWINNIKANKNSVVNVRALPDGAGIIYCDKKEKAIHAIYIRNNIFILLL